MAMLDARFYQNIVIMEVVFIMDVFMIVFHL